MSRSEDVAHAEGVVGGVLLGEEGGEFGVGGGDVGLDEGCRAAAAAKRVPRMRRVTADDGGGFALISRERSDGEARLSCGTVR